MRSFTVGIEALLRLRMCFLNLELLDSFGEAPFNVRPCKLSFVFSVGPAGFELNKFLIGVSNFFGEFVLADDDTAGGVN